MSDTTENKPQIRRDSGIQGCSHGEINMSEGKGSEKPYDRSMPDVLGHGKEASDRKGSQRLIRR